VVRSVHEFPLAPHYGAIEGPVAARSETQAHGIVEFENDRLGIFHWTSAGYDSGVRWWRTSRFYGERGPRANSAPTYGAEQARLDQEIILAIRESALSGNKPVSLPLPR